MRKVVNLVGRGKDFLNVNDYDGDIWAVNDMYNIGLKRIDILFDPHKLEELKIFKNRQDGTNHFENLRKLEYPIIMQKKYEEIPTSVGFPFGFFNKEEEYFTSTFCYMLAYALLNKFTEVNMFGVTCYNTKEYTQQRDGIAYWVGILRGNGIKVNFVTETNILNSFKYGIDIDTRELSIKPFIFNMTTLFEDITKDFPDKIQLRTHISKIFETKAAMEKIIKGERIVGKEFKSIISSLYQKIQKNDFTFDADDRNYILCIIQMKKEGG